MSSAERRPSCVGLNELIIQTHGENFPKKLEYIDALFKEIAFNLRSSKISIISPQSESDKPYSPSSSRWLKGYIYSSCYYHHQIGNIHLSHYFHIFPWLCAWDVCYIIFCVYCIYLPGKPGICFIIIVQLMMSTNIRIRFGLQIILVCLYSTPSHYYHCANLSEGIELIKCLSDIFCRVCE